VLKKLIILLLMVPLGAKAQFKSATMQIDGLTCSLCSYGVERAIKKLKFVEQVKVDLNTNIAEVQFKPSDNVSIKSLSKSVFDAGFSVRTLTATVDLSKVSFQKDHFLFGNDLFFILNEEEGKDSGRNVGIQQVTFVEKRFTDDSFYKKYKKVIEAKAEPLGINDYRYFILR
jgi:copper chaperone CopZ